jgi:hypothetical protein
MNSTYWGKKTFAFPVLLIVIMCLDLQVAYAQMWNPGSWPDTDFDLRSIELSEIQSGGPPKDGIPSIDSPKFDDVDEAGQWVNPLEPVIAVNIGGNAKAYPLKILIYHEIVNDEMNGVPITVTFCPLCNASIVFDRRYEGEVLDFGTTGLLRMSDLVMYDRQSESWWQQFSGKAIVGTYLGSELGRIPSSIVSFESFQKGFPQGQVLSRDTGFDRPYGRNPYTGYDDIHQSPFLFNGKIDSRLPPMERVLSVTIGDGNKIYPLTTLSRIKLVNDNFKSTPISIFAPSELLSVLDTSEIENARKVAEVTVWNRNSDAYEIPLSFRLENGLIKDDQTGSSWNVLGKAVDGPLMDTQLLSVESGVHFAFAWLAFNPDSEIYSTE